MTGQWLDACSGNITVMTGPGKSMPGIYSRLPASSVYN